DERSALDEDRQVVPGDGDGNGAFRRRWANRREGRRQPGRDLGGKRVLYGLEHHHIQESATQSSSAGPARGRDRGCRLDRFGTVSVGPGVGRMAGQQLEIEDERQVIRGPARQAIPDDAGLLNLDGASVKDLVERSQREEGGEAAEACRRG